MAILPTVKIQDGNSDDYIIINECDFNSQIHRVYVDRARKSKKKLVDSVTDENGDDTLIDGDVVNDGG